MLTRRQLLGGGATAVLAGGAYVAAAEQRVDVPGAARIRRQLGACGDDPGLPVGVTEPELQTGLLRSEFNDGPAEWMVSTPPGTAATDLGLIVVLHGSEGTAAHAFDDNHGLGRFQMQLIDNGADPFALALIDGGPTLWFDRDGDDRPQSMVADAFLPHLADMGFDIDRIGLYGWGAGGFGVLHLADRLGSERVAAIGSLSPAIFPAWDFVDGYYDNENEWSAHDPRLVLSTLEQVPLRIDCGADDPFAGEVEKFRNGIDPPPVGSISTGCRDYRYWHRMHPQMLEFVAAQL